MNLPQMLPAVCVIHEQLPSVIYQCLPSSGTIWRGTRLSNQILCRKQSLYVFPPIPKQGFCHLFVNAMLQIWCKMCVNSELCIMFLVLYYLE